MFYLQGNAWRRKPVPGYRPTLSGDIVSIIRRLSIFSRDNVSMSRNRRTHTFTPRVEFEFLNFKFRTFHRTTVSHMSRTLARCSIFKFVHSSLAGECEWRRVRAVRCSAVNGSALALVCLFFPYLRFRLVPFETGPLLACVASSIRVIIPSTDNGNAAGPAFLSSAIKLTDSRV